MTMRNRTTSGRKTRQPETFEFVFQGKTYMIHGRYHCQRATLVLSDGTILHDVRNWKISAPYEPAELGRIETFDPSQQSAADLAVQAGGFVAELVVQQPAAEGKEGQPQ